LLDELRDRYTRIKKLVKGTSSIIYTAFDNITQKKVIIKEFVYIEPEDYDFETDLTKEEQLERFKREVDIHFDLEHENIVKALDYYEQGDNVYLIIDYIPAKSIRELIEDGAKFDVIESINIIKQISSALQYIHDKGIIHRDIKPANILITEDKKAILIDFGCSKKIYTPYLTTAKMLIGTINYMSPEQLNGIADMDGRGDIFSLGCMFYQLLGNKLPFSGKDMKETVRNIFYSNPEPITKLNPIVPLRLEVIVHNTLKKDPDHRCSTAKLLNHYLDTLLKEAEIYYNQGKFYQEQNEYEKALSFYQETLEIDEKYFPAWHAIAELHYNNENWIEALKFYNHLIDIDSSKSDFYYILGNINIKLERYNQALKMYQRAWVLNPEEKEYDLKIASTLYLCDKVGDAMENYMSIVEHYKDWVQPKYELAVIYYKLGRKYQALVLLEESRELDNSNEKVLTILGSLYQEINDFEKAIEVYLKIEVMNPNSKVNLHNLACAYYQQKDFYNAKDKLDKLLNIHESVQGYILLGLVNENLNKQDEAIEIYKKTINLEPSNIKGYLYLSSVLRSQWRLNEAIDILLQAEKIETDIPKTDIYYQLGESFRDKGMFSEAKWAYKMCVSTTFVGSQVYNDAKNNIKMLSFSERKNQYYSNMSKKIV